MRILLATVLVLVLSTGNSYAQCCAAGNPIAGDGTLVPEQGNLRLLINYQRSTSDTYFEGKAKSDFSYKNAYYDFLSVRTSYTLTEQLNITANVGYFIKKGEEFVNTGYQRHSKGFGDVDITAKYQVVKLKAWEVDPFFTLRIPVGQFDQVFENILLPIDLQPSAGSFRYNPGVAFYKTFSNKKVNAYASTSIEFAEAIQTDRTINFKYGNLYLMSVGANLKLTEKLGVNLEVRDQIRDKSINNGEAVKASGGNVLFVIPRINYSYKKWIINGGVELPAYKNLNTIGYPQLSNKFAWNIGVTRNFKLKQDLDTVKYLLNSKVTVEQYFVNGLCDMCKDKIEGVANSFKNVGVAQWDQGSHILVVAFKKEVDSEELMKRIAESGYDNECFIAELDAYDSLHSCCKYR